MGEYRKECYELLLKKAKERLESGGHDALYVRDEAVLYAESKVRELTESIDALSKDWHAVSMRGCPTCKRISDAIGKPFGCYQHHEEMARIKAQRENPR